MCRFGLVCVVHSQGTRQCESSFFFFKLLFSSEDIQEGKTELTSCQSCPWLPCDSPRWREEAVTEGYTLLHDCPAHVVVACARTATGLCLVAASDLVLRGSG